MKGRVNQSEKQRMRKGPTVEGYKSLSRQNPLSGIIDLDVPRQRSFPSPYVYIGERLKNTALDDRRSQLQTNQFADDFFHNPRLFLTVKLAMDSNLDLSSRHIFEASTLAADSSLGSANIETTDNRIFSTLWTGLHLVNVRWRRTG